MIWVSRIKKKINKRVYSDLPWNSFLSRQRWIAPTTAEHAGQSQANEHGPSLLNAHAAWPCRRTSKKYAFFFFFFKYTTGSEEVLQTWAECWNSCSLFFLFVIVEIIDRYIVIKEGPSFTISPSCCKSSGVLTNA